MFCCYSPIAVVPVLSCWFVWYCEWNKARTRTKTDAANAEDDPGNEESSSDSLDVRSASYEQPSSLPEAQKLGDSAGAEHSAGTTLTEADTFGQPECHAPAQVSCLDIAR